MESQLDRAIKDTLTILTKVQPKDLAAPPGISWPLMRRASGSLSRRLEPTAPWAGSAGQLAAFLGRVV
jgi:hypothetical protein